MYITTKLGTVLCYYTVQVDEKSIIPLGSELCGTTDHIDAIYMLLTCQFYNK